MDSDFKINGKIVAWIVVGVLVVIFVIPTVISMFRTVSVGQIGIVTRYGRVVGIDPSGFHIISPLDSMVGMSVQNQLYVVQASSATSDLQDVTVEGALNFNVTSDVAGNLYKQVGVNYTANVVDPILKKDIKGITSQYSAQDLVDKRPAIEAQMQAQLTKDLANKANITVDNFAITNLTFSPQYTDAIEQAKVAAENVSTAQYKLQQAQLNAQANQVQDAALTTAILEQQAIAKWNGVLPTTIAGNSSSPILTIPLQ